MSYQYPEFIEDGQFVNMDTSICENAQLKAMLENLTRVHLLTAKKFNSFDELIREYLFCGIDVFGLETGIVSHIKEDGVYEVNDVVSPLDVLEKGQQFPLSDTYCKEVVKTERVLGFPEVGRLGFMECHPVYVALKLEAYLSAPIYVEEEIYGTLNFTSLKPRKNGFSVNEHNLIKLMASSIGNFILLRSKEKELLELNDRLKHFLGFVAHDLRSPIAGIIGLSRLSESMVGDNEKLKTMLPKITETAEGALELVSKILNTAALTTGKLSLEKVDVTLQYIMGEAENSIVDVASLRSIKFNLDFDSKLKVFCDPKMIIQAVVNLLVNAIKYSSSNSIVNVRAISSGQRCNILITNDLDESGMAQEALPSIYNSVGFGLDIVQTILSAHDTQLEMLKSATQFQASFELDLS